MNRPKFWISVAFRSAKERPFAERKTTKSALVAFVVLISLAAGCGPDNKSPNPGFGESPALAPSQDHFSLAMNFFQQLDSFEPAQTRKQVLDNLNRWIEDHSGKAWRADTLVERLPAPWNGLDHVRNLGKLEFGPDDIDFLQQAAWTRDISRWVSEQPLDPWLARRLPGEADGLSRSEVDRLATAARLFDWTIRNIQQDELLPAPKPMAAGPSADPSKPNERPPLPAFQAVPGPGYRHFPWQALLMGHGDALERARVFILLCRQEGIDAVMLGLIEGAPSAPPRAWLPAVIVKDRLYLFDTELGLPLPGPGGKGIATLAQVAADPKLLRQLDLDGEPPYRVSAESLTQVVALIDAPPESLSRRMQFAEARLSGDDRMVLTVAPSKLKDKLSGSPGVSGVQLWLAPYETIAYRAALPQLLERNVAARFAFYREEVPFSSPPGEPLRPLVKARYQHFRGVFDARDRQNKGEDASEQNSGREKPAARALYLASRPSDDDISRFANSEELLRTRGKNESPEAWTQRRNAMLEAMRNVRHHAAYWLGLTHYERQNYATAIDWFQRRTLDVDPNGPWTQGARYNLARSYEMQGDHSAAREFYFADDSPQRYGNRLRAEWLTKSKARE